MSVWDFVAGVFGPNRFKAVTEETWKLVNEYKERMLALEKESKAQAKQIAELMEYEQECQQRFISLTQQYRDVKEELIFIKKQK